MNKKNAGVSSLKWLAICAVFAFALAGCGGGGGGGAAGSSGTTGTVPAAPALSAVGSDTQVSLGWTSVSGATSYNLYWSTTAGVTPANGTKIAGVVGTLYTQSGLANGTTYYYVVTAVNAAGESAPSTLVSATPSAGGGGVVLTAPYLAATPNSTQVKLNWYAVSTATSYNLYWSTTSGVTPANGTKIGGLTGTSYIQTGLTNGTTYYYVLTAVNAAGESAPSPQASATPAAAPAGWSTSSILYSNGSQLTPTSASINDSGVGIALWGDWTAGYPTSSYASIYQNGAWSAASIPMGTQGANSASVSVNASGDAFVVYVQTVWNATLTANVSSSIYATLYHHATGIWSTPVQIGGSATAGSYANFPKVVADGLGNAMAVWHDPSNNVYASLYNGTTGTWGTGVAVSASGGGAPNIVVDGSNVFTAVWEQGTHSEPYAARYTTSWSTPQLIGWSTASLPGTNDTGGTTSVSANAAGIVFVVWAQTITQTGGALQYSVDTVQYNPATSTWSATPTHITASTVNWTSWPTVAVDGTGNAMAVWDETLVTTTTTTDVVQASRYTAGVWSAPAEIDLNNGDDVGVITFAMDASGNGDVMWEDASANYGSANYGTNRRHYDATGGTGWGAITTTPMKWTPLYSKSPKGYGILVTVASPDVYGYILTP